MQIKVQQLQDTNMGLCPGFRTVKDYLLSCVFQELIRSSLGVHTDIQISWQKRGRGCMCACGHLLVIVAHMLFVLSSLSATASAKKLVFWGWACYNSGPCVMGSTGRYTPTPISLSGLLFWRLGWGLVGALDCLLLRLESWWRHSHEYLSPATLRCSQD